MNKRTPLILFTEEKVYVNGIEITDKDSWEKVIDTFKELQKENERLKEENKCIFSKVNDDELLISNAMNYAEAQDYKSRCEKARLIIKGIPYGGNEDFYINKLKEIDDILQGVDKE